MAPLTELTVTYTLGRPTVLLVKVTVLAPLTEPESMSTPVKVAELLAAKKSPWMVPPVMLIPDELDRAPPSRSVPLVVTVQQPLSTRPLTRPPLKEILPVLAVTVPLTTELAAEN